MESASAIELLQRIKEDDHASFESLFNLYWLDLFKYAYRVIEDKDEAEDITQELFCDIWEARHALTIETNFKTYLFGILRKKILKTFRTKGVRKKHALILQNLLMSEYAPSPLSSIIASDLLQHLREYLNTLPNKEREVFILNQLEGYSVKEISKRFSTSEQTVRNQISTAFNKVFPFVMRMLI